MNWSPQQDKALCAVDNWLHARDPQQQVFRLFGYAGTGKTTLAKHLAEGVQRPLFAAYTGKAALVMQRMGCDASTIHKLIYLPKHKCAQTLRRLEQDLIDLPKDTPEKIRERIQRAILRERENLSKPAFSIWHESPVREASVVIIDECSMVGSRMGEDLLSFGIPVLALGDPAQLPPVGDGGFFTDHDPDFMLTEIHRQAEDSPVIEMATMVRRGEFLHAGRYGTCSVISRRDLDPELPLKVDQILVGRNSTRIGWNHRMRERLGRVNGLPEAGDKVVCLRNDYEVGVLNGSTWRVLECAELDSDTVMLSLESDSDTTDTKELIAWRHHFLGKENELPYFARRENQEFTYGYALTCHKAQGSQWGHVLVLDESKVFRQNRAQWLYTAITRAEHTVDVVL